MRALKTFLLMAQAGLLSSLAFASIARADCTDCQNGQRYCGQYDANAGRWISGAWESCGTNNPPPPPRDSCRDKPGRSELAETRVGSTTCRAVRPGSNECIARGSATVSIDNLVCVYNNFDGCGIFIRRYEQACGWRYNSCGC